MNTQIIEAIKTNRNEFEAEMKNYFGTLYSREFLKNAMTLMATTPECGVAFDKEMAKFEDGDDKLDFICSALIDAAIVIQPKATYLSFDKVAMEKWEDETRRRAMEAAGLAPFRGLGR